MLELRRQCPEEKRARKGRAGTVPRPSPSRLPPGILHTPRGRKLVCRQVILAKRVVTRGRASAKELAFVHAELDRAFARVLALLDEGTGDSQVAPALEAALGFLKGHHGLEDELVFPSLRSRAQGALLDGFVRLEAQHAALHDECEALLRFGDRAPDLRSRLVVLRGRLAEHCRDEERLLSPENFATLVSVEELRGLARPIESRFAGSVG